MHATSAAASSSTNLLAVTPLLVPPLQLLSHGIWTYPGCCVDVTFVIVSGINGQRVNAGCVVGRCAIGFAASMVNGSMLVPLSVIAPFVLMASVTAPLVLVASVVVPLVLVASVVAPLVLVAFLRRRSLRHWFLRRQWSMGQLVQTPVAS